MANTITEEQLQAKCTQWFWNEFPAERRMLFHVDNNSWNNIVGAKKKALGVVPGPSDLVFIVDNCVHFIEMKIPGGYQSKEQLDFMQKVEERGHSYVVIREFEDFKKYIIKQLTKSIR